MVVANRDTAVDKISPDQTTQIFLKHVQSWPDGKAIYPVDIEEGSPLRTEFYSKITGRSPAQLRAYWARQAFTGMGFPPRQVASAEEVSKIVQNTAGAIGYVGRNERDGTAKIVLDPGK
ncbi:phosphate ABC transporter substrate-binding protein [Paraburkholderia lacunae]|uniref:Phosphate ABC transporter substrate-binding protein n=1 Tax=Paraburkholderia lacunae TaxID=2211104 RepID=A0A370NET0_9BURK|nr:phosphate ABC transporter substrate-binding protein [Paraburkholderia lacunae]RDK04116.1 phosphate ABC transporter substrate-binding protein [Paraburkholderia lacunae]